MATVGVSETLPTTGADATQLALVALLLISLGIGAISIIRRRHDG